jgi:hypothetical protein
MRRILPSPGAREDGGSGLRTYSGQDIENPEAFSGSAGEVVIKHLANDLALAFHAL